MPPQNAVILDNWIPRAAYCEIRRGFVPQQTGTPGPVESMMAYRGGPAGDVLMAASAGRIYDVSVQNGALGAPLMSGLTSNRWTYTGFANAAGQWMIGVNGADAPIGYSAGALAALPAISGSSGPIVLNPNNLSGVTAHKGRLLFIEQNTLHVWFPAAGAVGGACQLLDLGSIFTKGGRLVAIGTWSWQFGVTADDFAVFMTDQGQIAIYAGIDPSDATNWSLQGVYDFGKPLGPNALIKYGGDLVVLTTDGALPLSQGLKLDRSEVNEVALTAKIRPAFAAAVRAYRANYGWQGILYAGDTSSSDLSADGGSLAIFNVPVSTLQESMQFVQNVTTGAWCRFPTGINAFCWEVANNAVYFGSLNGVYQWDVGASDNGQPIVAEVKPAFSSFGVAASKRFQMIRPLLRTSGLVLPAIDMDADYQNSVPVAVPSIVDAGSTTPEIRYDWTGSSAEGYVGAPHMVVNLLNNPNSPVLGVDGTGDVLGVDAEGDLLGVSPGVFDVPCQLIGFDILYQIGGQL